MPDRPPTDPAQEQPTSVHGAAAAHPLRSRWASHVGVAIIALALGVGGTWLLKGRGSSVPAAAGGEGHSSHAKSEGTAAQAGGPQRVKISPERQQLIGVRTGVIAPRDLVLNIRTVGVIAFDQTKVAEVHTRVQGWVERLFVNYEGKAVRRGQPLLSVYSPELLASQVDYLLGVQIGRNLSRTAGEPALAGSLEEAARRRLRLRDISEAQIEQLKRSGKPSRTLTLYSPTDGVLVERKTYVGQYISPELTAFKIADLSTIWVIAQVFESELRGLELGQTAEVLFPNDPSARPIKSTISFISPQVDVVTRRISVRLEFKNPGKVFKPDTYVTVVIRSSLGRELSVPKEAVIDTGARQYVLLALPGGYFEPRDVQVGAPVDEYYPVIGGLKSGDRVVTSAQFLVDSETNLQAAMQSMSLSMPGMKMDEGGAKGTPTPAPAKGSRKAEGGGGGMEGMSMPATDSGVNGKRLDSGTKPAPAHQH